jgi:predicted transcriptional regulator
MSTADDVKARRKALGWTRADLARRTALDKHIIQLVELGQWSEADALGRVQYVLGCAENGDLDVALPPIEPDGDDTVLGG